MDDVNNDSDIIFDFFKKLTNNELQPEDRKQPFNLYFGAERRGRILDAIMPEKRKCGKMKQQDGEKILANYRGSLDKLMEREKVAMKEIREKGQEYAQDGLETRKFMEKRLTEWERAKQPDPKDL